MLSIPRRCSCRSLRRSTWSDGTGGQIASQAGSSNRSNRSELNLVSASSSTATITSMSRRTSCSRTTRRSASTSRRTSVAAANSRRSAAGSGSSPWKCPRNSWSCACSRARRAWTRSGSGPASSSRATGPSWHKPPECSPTRTSTSTIRPRSPRWSCARSAGGCLPSTKPPISPSD